MLLLVTVFKGGWTLYAGESDIIERVDNEAIGSSRLVNGPAVGTGFCLFGPFLNARLAIEFVTLPTLYHVS